MGDFLLNLIFILISSVITAVFAFCCFVVLAGPISIAMKLENAEFEAKHCPEMLKVESELCRPKEKK